MKKSMKRVQCVLTQPIRGKGSIGDVVNIKPGYAKFLERFNKAIRASKDVLDNIESKKTEWKKLEENNLKKALEKLEKLKKFERITLYKRVSHADTLYSAVKQDEIIAFFDLKGIKLIKENIKIDKLIKTLGDHFIIINVYGHFEHNLVVEVCRKD